MLKKSIITLILFFLTAFLSFAGRQKGPGGSEAAEGLGYDELINKGTEFLNQNNYKKAEEIYKKALAVDSDNYRAYFLLGLTAFGQISAKKSNAVNIKKCEEAIQYFTGAVERHKNFPNSYALRGVSFELLTKNALAMEDYSRYLELVDENDNSSLKQNIQKRYETLAEYSQ